MLLPVQSFQYWVDSHESKSPSLCADGQTDFRGREKRHTDAFLSCYTGELDRISTRACFIFKKFL